MIFGFDEACSCWENDKDQNLMFLNIIGKRVSDVLRIRGYVYPNQIYEVLGKRWNPKDENVPYIYAEGICERLVFDIYPQEKNRFTIKVETLP